MGRRGNPYDNAKVESFMKTMKVEAVYLMDYETFQDVSNRHSAKDGNAARGLRRSAHMSRILISQNLRTNFGCSYHGLAPLML